MARPFLVVAVNIFKCFLFSRPSDRPELRMLGCRHLNIVCV